MHNVRQSLLTSPSQQPFAWFEGRAVSRGSFWADVDAIADSLPDMPYIFNLCENRYLFCVYLLAAAKRGQLSLLPPSNQAAVIREILRDYPAAYLVGERDPQWPYATWFKAQAPRSPGMAPPAEIDWKNNALIAFTSGSTGKPKPCLHSLESFRISAGMAVSSLGLARQQLIMLSTTPPQHMYGLETSVFWPLFSSLILHDGRPFFPEDIRQAVEAAAWPVMLVSTPTHLRALTAATDSLPNLSGIISATDVLSEKLADEIDRILGQSPREIYGSTETLSFAARETLRESLWLPYTGCRLSASATGGACLESPHLQGPLLLQDSLSILEDGRFALLGRHHDMIKIGGKRASLSELNRRLKDVAGVEDGFCFVQRAGTGADRLAAVVVSRLDKQSIRSGLQAYVDEVFLPRKIFYVAAIPRNQTGKLVNAEMEKLLADWV